MRNHDFDTAILHQVAHRPWPMEPRPWVMTQTWHGVFFAHWRVELERLRARVPPPFELDLFDGAAWLSVMVFDMTNVAPRGVPSLPWLSAFPELNVRTYVRVGTRPGVYFFSLDAGRALAAAAARALLNLPYYAASLEVTRDSTVTRYRCVRRGGSRPAFDGACRPAGASYHATAGSLEYFLAERYCLYHQDHFGRPYRLDIHHPPWPLQDATGDIRVNSMTDLIDPPAASSPRLMHYAARQDVVAWPPTRVG